MSDDVKSAVSIQIRDYGFGRPTDLIDEIKYRRPRTDMPPVRVGLKCNAKSSVLCGRSYKASARGSRKVNFEYGLRVRRRRNLQRTKLISLLFVPAGE
jgi:hypothetical protein